MRKTRETTANCEEKGMCFVKARKECTAFNKLSFYKYEIKAVKISIFESVLLNVVLTLQILH